MRLLLYFYRQAWRLSQWGRRRFSFVGHVLLLLLVAAAVFGVNTKQTTSYQLFVLLLLLMLLSMVATRFHGVRVEFKRQLPRCAMMGELVHYRLQLRLLSGTRDQRLSLFEQLAANDLDLDGLKRFYGANPKRWYSYRDWLRFVAYQRGAILAEVALPELAQGECSVMLSFRPSRRGSLHFTTSYLACPDVFGLCRYLLPLAQPQTLLVLPKRYVMPSLTLDGQRKYQAGGVALASSVGNSSEFMSLRDYQRGDPLNSIHWKSYAKHGKLIVKEYQDEYFVRRALVLDTFVDHAPPEQFEAAVSVAASLALCEQQNEALLDLMFVGQQVHCFTSGRSVDHVPHLQEILANVEASESGRFELLQQAVLARASLCSSLVFVLMSWDFARQQLLAQLLRRGLPLAVFLLHDGHVSRESCDINLSHFYLLDYRYLERDLLSITTSMAAPRGNYAG